jgi:hypothetical protein
MHCFNALQEKGRSSAGWLVWTQMRVVLLEFCDQVSFQVVTMSGKTIQVTCQVMLLIAEVCDLIKAQLLELTNMDLKLCKGVVVLESYDTLHLRGIQPDDVLTVIVVGVTARTRLPGRFLPPV